MMWSGGSDEQGKTEVHEFTDEFKREAVKLCQQPGAIVTVKGNPIFPTWSCGGNLGRLSSDPEAPAVFDGA